MNLLTMRKGQPYRPPERLLDIQERNIIAARSTKFKLASGLPLRC